MRSVLASTSLNPRQFWDLGQQRTSSGHFILSIRKVVSASFIAEWYGNITGYLGGIFLARADLSIFFFQFLLLLWLEDPLLLKNKIKKSYWFYPVIQASGSIQASRQKVPRSCTKWKTYGRGNRNKEDILDFKNKNKPYWLL